MRSRAFSESGGSQRSTREPDGFASANKAVLSLAQRQDADNLLFPWWLHSSAAGHTASATILLPGPPTSTYWSSCRCQSGIQENGLARNKSMTLRFATVEPRLCHQGCRKGICISMLNTLHSAPWLGESALAFDTCTLWGLR